MLTIADVVNLLKGELLCGDEFLKREVCFACGSDLMSDVLAFTKQKTLLLTGLTNIQAVRTAEISDLVGIVFVRGKYPGADVIQFAKSLGIPLIVTGHPMYEACGILYSHKLRGCSQGIDPSE